MRNFRCAPTIAVIISLWIFASSSISIADDASLLSNLDTQSECTIRELPEKEGQSLFPWELIKDNSFKKAYVALLRQENLKERWLSTLNGPATKNRLLHVGGKKFVYMQSCKQHECNTHTIRLLFSPQEKRIYGKLVEGNSIMWLGSPTVCDKEAMEIFAHK